MVQPSPTQQSSHHHAHGMVEKTRSPIFRADGSRASQPAPHAVRAAPSINLKLRVQHQCAGRCRTTACSLGNRSAPPRCCAAGRGPMHWISERSQGKHSSPLLCQHWARRSAVRPGGANGPSGVAATSGAAWVISFADGLWRCRAGYGFPCVTWARLNSPFSFEAVSFWAAGPETPAPIRPVPNG